VNGLLLKLAQIVFNPPANQIAQFTPLVTGLVAVLGFPFGVFQYRKQQKLNRDAAAESRDREFYRPLWEKQLALYFDASEAAATIATSSDPEARRQAEAKFWMLYSGPLVVVESPEVSGAMKNFGKCLEDETRGGIQELSLALASAFQISLTHGADLRLVEFSKGKFDYSK
jgi:hypothetical protein